MAIDDPARVAGPGVVIDSAKLLMSNEFCGFQRSAGVAEPDIEPVAVRGRKKRQVFAIGRNFSTGIFRIVEKILQRDFRHRSGLGRRSGREEGSQNEKERDRTDHGDGVKDQRSAPRLGFRTRRAKVNR